MLKKFFLFVSICLLLGALPTQLSAQSEVLTYDALCWTEVHCDGEFLGYIYGICFLREVEHSKDGEWIFSNYVARGEAACTFSDENFKYVEKGKVWDKNDGVSYYIIQAIGDQGSIFHFHLAIDFNTTPETWTFDKAICQ